MGIPIKIAIKTDNDVNLICSIRRSIISDELESI